MTLLQINDRAQCALTQDKAMPKYFHLEVDHIVEAQFLEACCTGDMGDGESETIKIFFNSGA